MLSNTPPVLNNEADRILTLSALDLDYSALENNFRDLTTLAAKLTGSPVSLINLIDSFTQWTVSNHGLPIQSMPREDSVCQYTIAGEGDHFEVKNLAADPRFNDKFYVNKPDGFRYYMGVPLKSNNGSYIGALCVLNTDIKELGADDIELLKIIANEIVARLEGLKVIHELSDKLSASQEDHKALARNIREPLAGVISILDVITDRAKDINVSEILEYIGLIQKSNKAILALTDAVLDTEEERELNDGEGNLIWLKNSIEKLYTAQCRQKGVDLNVVISSRTENIPFHKNKLLQIAGNLLSYAIKHTPVNGNITVKLALKVEAARHIVEIIVEYLSDKAEQTAIEKINNDKTELSNDHTTSEQALVLVKQMVNSLKGNIDITPGANTVFNVSIPQNF